MKKIIYLLISIVLSSGLLAQNTDKNKQLFYALDSMVTSYSEFFNVDTILNQDDIYVRNFPILVELLEDEDTIFFAFDETTLGFKNLIQGELRKKIGNDNIILTQATPSNNIVVIGKQFRKHKKMTYNFGYRLFEDEDCYREIISNKKTESKYDLNVLPVDKYNYVKYKYKKDKLISINVVAKNILQYTIKNGNLKKITYHDQYNRIQILMDSNGNKKALIYKDANNKDKDRKFKYPIQN